MLYFKVNNIKTDQDLMRIISKIKDSLVDLENPHDKIMVVSFYNISCDSSEVLKIENKNL